MKKAEKIDIFTMLTAVMNAQLKDVIGYLKEGERNKEALIADITTTGLLHDDIIEMIEKGAKSSTVEARFSQYIGTAKKIVDLEKQLTDAENEIRKVVINDHKNSNK